MLGWRVFALTFVAFSLIAQDDGPAFFEKNIRPLLAQQCLGCHSGTSQPIMGSLRLDARDLTIKGGGRVFLQAGRVAPLLCIKTG